MSKNKKKKKSTTQYKSSGFLIPAIAVLEAIVLVVVASFAWYYYSSEKTLSSAVITVNADSGLEIDFKDADNKNFIDLWDQIDGDFMFEPATSVDGRNIYFPTSGTFGEYENTNNMVFREGTANDVNSKYLSVDFKLTNTSSGDMDVYLSDRSRFTLLGDNNTKQNGKALRLAFYNNDGNTGKVDSTFTERHASILDNSAESGSSTTSSDSYTVYFNKNYNNWSNSIRAYVYDDAVDDATTYYYNYTDSNGVSQSVAYPKTGWRDVTINGKIYTGSALSESDGGDGYFKAWPGEDCTPISQDLYAYTFSNPFKTQEVTLTDTDGRNVTITVTSNRLRKYTRVIFNDTSGHQVPSSGSPGYVMNSYTPASGGDAEVFVDRNNHMYTCDSSTASTEISLITVYFLKPDDWGTPNCRPSVGGNSGFYNGGSGTNMTYVATGIYSYTFPNVTSAGTMTYLFFKDSTNGSNESLVQANIIDGALYYFPDPDATASVTSKKVYTTSYGKSNIYFYNTVGWTTPYAYVNAFADEVGTYTYSIQMIELSDKLYYCEVPDIFLKDIMATRTDAMDDATPTPTTIGGSSLPDNCQVYFGNASSSPSQRTALAEANSNYVYVPGGSSSPYSLEANNQAVTADSYAVIAPGVSAGFQRLANPVETIETSSGAVDSILPAFASSFDDYIMGSNNPIFTIGAGKTVNMSMIIWLEGTDKHCTAANYAANNIELYLEFSTEVTADASSSYYTYQFIDATEETWTSDTITKGSGSGAITVDPVIQLYDVSNDRGYLMKAKSYTYNKYGKSKVSVWQCIAPKSLTDTRSQHVIEFRRVNPYNEEEIWNCWQAGNLPDYRGYALSGGTVTFTAFADGSPLSATDMSTGNSVSVPAYSCGGLWGNHDTCILYFYDGRRTNQRDIPISPMNGKQTNLFLNYTYTYGEGKSAQIEYKASNDGGSNFFTFVVPTGIFEQHCAATFKNYYWKSGESAYEAGDAVLRQSFSAGGAQGQFYELNCEYDGTDASYWGSDVIYLTGPDTLSVSYSCRGVGHSGSSHDDCEMRITYYKKQVSGNNVSYTNQCTKYLYDDIQNYNSSLYNYQTSGYRFVSVVPCNAEYNGYEILRFSDLDENGQMDLPEYEDDIVTDNRDLTRDVYCDDTITHPGDEWDGVNTVASDNRICNLEYDWKIIYSGTHSSLNSAKATCFCTYTHNGSTRTDTQVDSGTDPEDDLYINGKRVYCQYVPSNSTKMYFRYSVNNNYKYTTDVLGSSNIHDCFVYYPTGAYSGQNLVLGTQDLHDYNWFETFIHTYNSTVSASYADKWPKYTATSEAPDIGG